MNQPHQYRKGDRVRDIYTGEEYTVKRSYWQNYAGGDTSDYTVEFEPTDDQPTPWNKSRNLEMAECDGHPAGPFDPMGETVYCDGSCKRRR